MKKITLASCVLIVVALLISARWATRADEAPASNTLGTPDTTLAVALSLEDMVDQSDVIALGSVQETRSAWVDGTLVTLASVSVGETLKGAESESLIVVLPGGVDANRQVPVAVSYPGAPRMTPGEDVFLFLNSDVDYGLGYNVTGFAQGKFSVVSDEDGDPVVSRDLTRMTLKSNNGVRRGGANAIPLASFKEQVKARLNK